MNGKGGSALYKSLPTPKKMVEIYSVAVENNDGCGGLREKTIAVRMGGIRKHS